LGEILAPSPPASAEKKKRPSSSDLQQEQQEPQEQQTYSTPQQEEDAAARASVDKTLADASTLFPFTSGSLPLPPPGATTITAMPDTTAADVTGMLASLSLTDEEKERQQQQQRRRQSAAAILMPPPPPPSMSNSSSLASINATPPTQEVTPPNSTTGSGGGGDRGDSINSNLLPAFATPSKQTPSTGRKGSAARRRYTISPMLTRTPKKLEPRLGDKVLKVREGGEEGWRKGLTFDFPVLRHAHTHTSTHPHDHFHSLTNSSPSPSPAPIHLQAAVDTAACLTSPISEWKKQKAVFDACALSRATPEHNKIQVGGEGREGGTEGGTEGRREGGMMRQCEARFKIKNISFCRFTFPLPPSSLRSSPPSPP